MEKDPSRGVVAAGAAEENLTVQNSTKAGKKQGKKYPYPSLLPPLISCSCLPLAKLNEKPEGKEIGMMESVGVSPALTSPGCRAK